MDKEDVIHTDTHTHRHTHTDTQTHTHTGILLSHNKQFSLYREPAMSMVLGWTEDYKEV